MNQNTLKQRRIIIKIKRPKHGPQRGKTPYPINLRLSVKIVHIVCVYVWHYNPSESSQCEFYAVKRLENSKELQKNSARTNVFCSFSLSLSFRSNSTYFAFTLHLNITLHLHTYRWHFTTIQMQTLKPITAQVNFLPVKKRRKKEKRFSHFRMSNTYSIKKLWTMIVEDVAECLKYECVFWKFSGI